MSIANLFSPNDYQLYCQFMSFGDTGSIYAVVGEPAVLTDVGGCITSADFLTVSYFRLNDIVTIRWVQTKPIAIATAVNELFFIELITARFRPMQTVTTICGVIGDSGGLQTTFPGQVSVDPAGVMRFSFLNSGHAGSTTWVIGERVGVLGGSITYTTTAPL